MGQTPNFQFNRGRYGRLSGVLIVTRNDPGEQQYAIWEAAKLLRPPPKDFKDGCADFGLDPFAGEQIALQECLIVGYELTDGLWGLSDNQISWIKRRIANHPGEWRFLVHSQVQGELDPIFRDMTQPGADVRNQACGYYFHHAAGLDDEKDLVFWKLVGVLTTIVGMATKSQVECLLTSPKLVRNSLRATTAQSPAALDGESFRELIDVLDSYSRAIGTDKAWGYGYDDPYDPA